MDELNVELLMQLNTAIPRYTSYPTAPEWQPISSQLYEERLALLAQRKTPLSLYVHIPFCQTMCLFCACSVVLNRLPENEERYVEYLCREIRLVGKRLGEKKKVQQLHFGGGTPTKISEALLEQLFTTINEVFDFTPDAEVAIEIDPRTVAQDEGQKLTLLKRLGFNRVSFGVQDMNPKVQEAIKRRQSAQVTCETYFLARGLGFESINVDLIYGLPYQTSLTFKETIEKIIDLRPDRIALFSYAKVPWLKPHQKAIKEETLPSTEEKFSMYLLARKLLVEAGYSAIGMDHFALPTDELALAYHSKTLKRNFQGYTVLPVDDLIGFGITSVGYVSGGYFQNVKELANYYELLEKGELPAFRGKVLDEDDLIRRWVIQHLMYDFCVDKELFFKEFGQLFDRYFEKELKLLPPYIALGLLEEGALQATALGQLFIRNISSCFDKYLFQNESPRQFSRAI